MQKRSVFIFYLIFLISRQNNIFMKLSTPFHGFNGLSFFLFSLVFFVGFGCQKAKEKAKEGDFLLTKWDTLPIVLHFTDSMVAGDVNYAFYAPVGKLTLNGQEFDVPRSKDDNFVELLMNDTILAVNSEALRDTLAAKNQDYAPRRVVFAPEAFAAFAAFGETGAYSEIWNVLPVREWLRRNADTLQTSALFSVNLDKDADAERILDLKSIHNRRLRLTLDLEGKTWLLTNATETQLYEEDANPPFNRYFDNNTHCWIEEKRYQGSDGEDDSGSESEVRIMQSVEYFYKGKWCAPLYIPEKESCVLHTIGKFRFVTETSSRFSFDNDTTITVIDSSRTTGGWLKTPNAWSRKTRYRLRKNEFVSDATQPQKKELPYWGNSLPRETFTDSTFYWLGIDKKIPLKTVTTYKIVENSGYLSTQTFSEFYFYKGKKWATTKSGDATLIETIDRAGEPTSLAINNKVLATQLDSLTNKNSALAATKPVFTQKWLDSLQQGNVPFGLQQLPVLRTLQPGLDRPFLAAAKVRVLKIPTAAKIVIVLENEQLGELNYFLTLETPSLKLVHADYLYQNQSPSLLGDMLLVTTIAQDGRGDGDELFADKDAREYNCHKWIDDDWKIVFNLSNIVTVGRDLRQETSVKMELKNGYLQTTYQYNWTTNDKKTTLLTSKPLVATWKYNAKTTEYDLTDPIIIDGKPLKSSFIYDIEQGIFTENYAALRKLQTSGSPAQRKWLDLYLDFYADHYEVQPLANNKVRYLKTSNNMTMR